MLRPPAVKERRLVGALSPRGAQQHDVDRALSADAVREGQQQRRPGRGDVLEYQSGIAWGRDAEEQVNALVRVEQLVRRNRLRRRARPRAQRRARRARRRAGRRAQLHVLAKPARRRPQCRRHASPTSIASPSRSPAWRPAALPGLDFNVPDMFLPIAQREYFYPQSTLLRAWEATAGRRHVWPAAPRRVRRRGARGAAVDDAGGGRRTPGGQER